MSTVEEARTLPQLTSTEPASQRRRRALVLLAGGAVVGLLIAPIGPVAFYWMPTITGLTYLVGAAIAGPRGALWGPGFIVTSFGVGVLLGAYGAVSDANALPVAVFAIGVGATLAAAARYAGFAVTVLSLALSVLLLGVFLLLTFTWAPGLFDNGWAYGALLGGWGLWELRPGGGTAAGRGRQPVPATG